MIIGRRRRRGKRRKKKTKKNARPRQRKERRVCKEEKREKREKSRDQRHKTKTKDDGSNAALRANENSIVIAVVAGPATVNTSASRIGA